MSVRFRIRQNNKTINAFNGEEAESIVMHYAEKYRRDGEVTIQHNAEGHWKRYALLCQWPTPEADQ